MKFMGWGISFSLDEHGRIYCTSGCKWRARESDYEGHYPWPSAREYVLEYFEGDGHKELDMIRDEFPGTAAGLAAACPEYMSNAFRAYSCLSDEEKMRRHTEKMEELEYRLDRVNKDIEESDKTFKEAVKAYDNVKKNERTFRKKSSQIEQQLILLKAEFEMEREREILKSLKHERTQVKNEIKREKMFLGVN